ncbi:hypothetical protein [Fulvivirga aurantia]|uniref:hypothetical protein n=1 Tax=Fulvivirga aurantia TaxID=2529383 RepID=UPI0012BCE1CE|nr:hypothetical protein [Fulvivirga aurantia]
MKIATFLVLTTGLLLSSCINDPNFPSTPQIDLVDVKFFKGATTSAPDSLQVTISFEDGEGDLGLSSNETAAPYNLADYFNNKTGRPIDFSQGGINLEDLLTYKNRATIDTLPPFEEPFTCTRWTTTPELFSDTTRLQDTVYFQFNPRHNNFFVNFYVKESGSFRKIDFREELDCSTTFDGRFPLLNKEDNQNTPKEGSITYNMQSRAFQAFFGDKTIQLQIRIVDRAGNFSRWVTTDEFKLQDIQAN